MIKIIRFSGVIVFLLSPISLYSQINIQADDFTYNTPVERGSFITLRYTGNMPLNALEIVLYNSIGDRIQSTNGFAYREPNRKKDWIAMLGIPSTAVAGQYMLAITVNKRQAHTIAVIIDVLDRPFDSELIVLDERLTGIRTDISPERIEQSEVYYELINSVSKKAIFSTEMLQEPTDTQRVTSGFGDRRLYQYHDGSTGSSVHNGVDYAAPVGTVVRAATAGLVRMAQERITTGNTIVLEHIPGVMTVYFHLDSMEVMPGDIVNAGEHIGTIGSTGLSTGAHLHWELRVGGVAVDPAPYLSRPLLDTLP